MTTAPLPSTGAGPAGPAPAPATARAAPAGTACCGASLEYDPEYLLLMARMVPAEAVQYGSFVGTSAAPDWPAIERDLLRLLDRSQDIALLVGLCRAASHEPSSPVALLLQQAERLVGKRYAEVADALPPELLRAWDQAMPVAGAESAP